MVKTRSMTRNQSRDNDDASSSKSRKRKNSCGGVASAWSWSDVTHDVLYLVMMRAAGVVEFLSFGGVCKSWRSLALSNSNRKMFMASKPPMLMFISPCGNNKTCLLQDFEGRKFKTMIPQLGGRECLGLSCGYLILFGEKTRDFWLVNPITRHQLHFPNVPTIKIDKEITIRIRAVLVFSPSLNSWVFVMTSRATYEIWFSIAEEGEGKGGAWNRVSSSFRIIDIHAFKGKIYTLTYAGDSWLRRHVCELRLDPPVPKLTLLDTHFVGSTSCVFNFVSSDENLYVMQCVSRYAYMVHKPVGSELNCVWAPCEKTRQEYALFHSGLKFSVAVKPESWPSSSSSSFFDANRRGDGFYSAKGWYFPHACLNVNYYT